ncbi:hypothetical protein FOZ63_029498 [Perkinsus olseni]|uniref:Transmembrane protein n=1 Tax=Perkinsus olseni TaxID=32597 RepID=A0A7J6SNS3_PEROL|nr:hypothetical protein FOZ63_029498 [Perkinsus olseni]
MGGLGLADLDRVYDATAEEEEESGRHHHNRSSCSTIHHDNKGKNRAITDRQRLGHDSALRGVSLSDVAARWLIFMGPKGTSSTYDLSRPVDHLDLFLSHSWGANMFWKHLSLITAYYMHIGYIVMLTLSISLSIMIYFLPSDREVVAYCVEIGGLAIVCVAVAFGCFFTRLFHKDPVVFLDKCCISQTDTGLKTHEPGRVTFISNMQTKFCMLVAICEVAILVTMMSIDLSMVANRIESFTPLILYLALEAAVTVIISTIVCFIFIPAKANLQAQITNFTVASAQCTLQEDRAFIRESITKWYGSEAQFEENLRAHWDEIASTQMPIWTLSRRGVYIVVAPFLAYGIPGLAFSLSADGLHPVPQWWIPLRDMLILTIMLGCRTPLIANVAYKLYAINTSRSRFSRLVLYAVIVAFGLAYDATLVVGGGAALFSNTTRDQIKIPEPYGWVFVIPVVFVLVYLYMTYTRHTNVSIDVAAATAVALPELSLSQQDTPTTSSSV